MKRITEVESPTLGEKYLVPCFYNESNKWLKDQWIPILYADFSHSDPSLGLSSHHYHFDTRFISGANLNLNIKDGICHASAIVQEVWHDGESLQDLIDYEYVTWRSRTCFRTSQLFPQTHLWEEKIVKKLENLHQHDRMKDMICPHKGTCLKGHHQKVFHGRSRGVICPAHGLAWDLESGLLIKQK